MKAKCLIAISIVFLLVLLVLLAIMHPYSPIRNQIEIREKISQIKNCNHKNLLQACRNMIANRHQYAKLSKRNDPDKIFVNFTREGGLIAPKEVMVLAPAYGFIYKDHVMLVFFGGFDHLAVNAFEAGVKGFGSIKLCDGLWIYHD